MTQESSSAKNFERYIISYTKRAKDGLLPPAVSRDEDATRLAYILLRYYKPNPVLIGPMGVGKRSIVYALANLIATDNSVIPSEIRKMDIVGIDQGKIIAETNSTESYENLLKEVINYIGENKNYILFMPDTLMIAATGSASSSPTGRFLKIKIMSGDIKTIICADLAHYKSDIETDTNFFRYMQTVYIEEPNVAASTKMLESAKAAFEKKHGVVIADNLIRTAVNLADRYVKQRTFPEKAFDLMDEACTVTLSRGKRELSESELAGTISLWTGIPVDKVDDEEKKRLLGLEGFLSKRVIGQPTAVRMMAAAIRRARSGLQDVGRPIGTFFFIGTTGVGKTELAKAIAEFLFHDEKALLRLDMSEYMEKQSINRLIGPPAGTPGYENGGLLTEAVRLRPYQVVLFDELEKANKDLITLLLQILDEGRLTDARGNEVDFRNTVVIMTSNVAADVASYKRAEVLGQYLRPELLARIDEIVSFSPLSLEHFVEIVKIHVRKLYKKLETLNIKMEVTDDAIRWMATETLNAKNGVRQMRRLLHRNIETPLSMLILANKIDPERIIYVNANPNGQQLDLSYTKKELDKKGMFDEENAPEAPVAQAKFDLKDTEEVDEDAEWVKAQMAKKGM